VMSNGGARWASGRGSTPTDDSRRWRSVRPWRSMSSRGRSGRAGEGD